MIYTKLNKFTKSNLYDISSGSKVNANQRQTLCYKTYQCSNHIDNILILFYITTITETDKQKNTRK